MTNNKIQMPANFVALNENEMSCVEGGGIVSQICYAFGRMFRSTYYDNWESESKTLEQSHGAVVSKKNGVYTYSDGYTHTMSGGSNWYILWRKNRKQARRIGKIDKTAAYGSLFLREWFCCF